MTSGRRSLPDPVQQRLQRALRRLLRVQHRALGVALASGDLGKPCVPTRGADPSVLLVIIDDPLEAVGIDRTLGLLLLVHALDGSRKGGSVVVHNPSDAGSSVAVVPGTMGRTVLAAETQVDLSTVTVSLLGTAVFVLTAILATSMFAVIARMDTLRVELRSEIAALRVELRAEMADLRDEMRELRELLEAHLRAHA